MDNNTDNTTTTKRKIEDLSREELIRVIASMHDAILTWDAGCGFNDKDSANLNAIGSDACASIKEDVLTVPEYVK